MTARYRTPGAFRQALEDRIRRGARDGLHVQRRRQLVVFSRLLARIADGIGAEVILKGGFALELRLEQARTTRDIDLAVLGSDAALLERLQAAGQRDAGDFMTFEIQPDGEHPDVTGDSAEYGGKRFRVACRLAGKEYGARWFGLDVAFGGRMLGPPSAIAMEPYLDFAGIASPTVHVLPIETHIAEKLHAYTLPRTVLNTRVKDLPDLALLATAREPPLLASRIRVAIHETFQARRTHAAPTVCPAPPPEWQRPYEKLVADLDLPWPALSDVARAAKAFLDPVLGGAEIAAWHPDSWRWAAQ